MANVFISFVSLLFGACCALIMVLARLLGWTYTEACVYINLYLQYGVMMLSTLSVVYVAWRRLAQGFSIRRLWVLALTVLYNLPFVGLGVWMYQRYGGVNPDEAFELCKNDLWALGLQLNFLADLPGYREGWTEYFVVNILIFIVLYLLVFFVDWGLKKLIKKYV